MDRDTGVGHPGKAGVPQVVSARMLVAELGDDLVPVSRVPQDRAQSSAERLVLRDDMALSGCTLGDPNGGSARVLCERRYHSA